MGIIVGAAFSFSTIALANDTTIQASLFPVNFSFGGKFTKLPDDYVSMNYNGHVYVPVRFISENMNSAVIYDQKKNTVFIESDLHSDLNLMAPNEERVRVGDLHLTYANGSTSISGKIQVLNKEAFNIVHAATLHFYDDNNKLLADVSISEPGQNGGEIQVNLNEVKQFTLTAPGDITKYKNVTLTVFYLNYIVNERPQ